MIWKWKQWISFMYTVGMDAALVFLNKSSFQKEKNAVADILGPDSLSIIGNSWFTSYDSVTDDSCEDASRTCTIIIPPQSSHETLSSGSLLIFRPMSVDWGLPITKKSSRPKDYRAAE